MIVKVNVREIRRNAILMVARSSARLVLQGVTVSAESGVAAILLHEANGQGARV
jgi:hypothetical protein